MWPAGNCGRVHSKSYWSVRRARWGGGRRVRRPLTGVFEQGKEAWRVGFREQWIWNSMGDGERWGDWGTISSSHPVQGGHSLLPVIIFKRLHPQSVSIMKGLFGHSQFYSLLGSSNACLCSLCVLSDGEVEYRIPLQPSSQHKTAASSCLA